MISKLLSIVTVLAILSFPKVIFMKVPDFGIWSNVAHHSSNGPVSNTAIFPPIGNVGTNSDVSTALVKKEVSPIVTRLSAVLFDHYDLTFLPSLTTASIALGLTNYYLTIYPPSIADYSADAVIANTFATAVGARIDPYIDCRWTSSDFDWIKSTFPNAEYYMINQESQDFIGGITSKPAITPYYSDLTNAAISHLSGWAALPIVDCALVYKTNPKAVARKKDIQLIPNSAIGRQYIQIQPDIILAFSTDQNDNFNKLQTYFSTTLPGYLTQFGTDYPNIGRQAVVQFHIEDAGSPHYVSPYPIGNWTIGKVVEFTLTNTSKFSYLCWMQYRDLFAGIQPNPEYYSLKRVCPLFKYKNVSAYDFKIAGVSGIKCSNTNGTRALLINNSTGTDYIIPKASISNVVGSFTRNTGYGASWGGANIYENNVVETDILVRKYSSSVVTYSIK